MSWMKRASCAIAPKIVSIRRQMMQYNFCEHLESGRKDLSCRSDVTYPSEVSSCQEIFLKHFSMVNVFKGLPLV